MESPRQKTSFWELASASHCCSSHHLFIEILYISFGIFLFLWSKHNSPNLEKMTTMPVCIWRINVVFWFPSGYLNVNKFILQERRLSDLLALISHICVLKLFLWDFTFLYIFFFCLGCLSCYKAQRLQQKAFILNINSFFVVQPFSVFACQLPHETHFPIVSHGTPWNARQVKYLYTFPQQPFLCNKDSSKVPTELMEREAKGDPCCFMLEGNLQRSSKKISAKTRGFFVSVHWGKAESMHCPQGVL